MTSATRTIRPSRVLIALRHAMKAKRPVFLWGPPGIGKSDIVNQLAEAADGAVVDIRLSLMEPTDLRGIPFFDRDSGMMKWAPPIDLPSAEFASQFPVVILFLDEMNAAPPSVQAAAYQLTLNRRIGNYILPDNVVIVAAGNRESDKGVAFKMPSPLANRFIHLEMEVNFNDWQEWAIEHDIHPDVVGFLTYSKSSLYDFDPKSSTRAFATPRSWSFVSDLLQDDIDANTLNDLVSGTVGEGLALSFNAHRQVRSKLPNPSRVLDGTITELESTEISAMYSLAINLCYELRAMEKAVRNGTCSADEFISASDNFFGFILQNFEDEMAILTAKIALCNYKINFPLEKLTNFGEFFDRYATMVIQADKAAR